MYDEIGNLIEDKAEQITNIKWSVYGKILEISRNATPKVNVTNIKYTYDALGNRISKEYDLNGTKQYFWYVRDAQGNLLGTYKAETETVVPLASLDVNLVERHIYGSSRLGMYALTQGVDGGPADMQYYTTNTFTRGRRQYELSNHLGNVLITLSDRKFGVSSGGSLIDYYEPDMLAGNDYYPFGMLSRVATSTSGTEYRFGFNGKEHDSEAKGWQNQIDYGMRIYDPRVGRFLSVDPITRQYPQLTPYQYASNRPIDGVDLDGLEWSPAAMGAGAQWAENHLHKKAMQGDKKAQEYYNSLISARIKLGLGQFGLATSLLVGPYVGNWAAGTIIRITTNPAIMSSASTAGLVAGKYGPDAVNIIYGLTTGDDMEPIPTSTGWQSADVGVLLRRMFVSPIADIRQFLKNAGAENITFVKGTTGKKVAVIGQGMEKVKRVAAGLQNPEVFTPTKEAQDAYELVGQYKAKDLLVPDEVVKGTQLYKENVKWINDVKKEGYDILDTGGGTTSTFYNMEKQAVYGEKGQ